jgi:hypothetical protein
VKAPAGAIAAAAVLAATAALAAEPEAAMRGGWVAKAGANVFKGRWAVFRPSPSSPDAQGTWTLLGADDDVVLDGTWSARRDGKTWKGTWAARTRPGALFSGTWQTTIAGVKGKTFFDLLTHAKSARIAGAWRMGRTNGEWWLDSLSTLEPSKGSNPPAMSSGGQNPPALDASSP